MDMPAARRAAHGAVAALISVNCFNDSDLYCDFTDLSEADLARVDTAMNEIIEYHRKRSHG